MTKPTNNQLTAAERLVDSAFQTADAENRMQAAQAQVLATYLAHPEGRRAPLWRQMTDAQRRLLVTQMLIAKYGDTTEEEISGWVKRTNLRWGSEPTQSEVVTLEVLDEMVNTSDERSGKAYLKARELFQAGVRPIPIVGGWNVPSASEAGSWYAVSHGGSCGCLGAYHGRRCWHSAMVACVDIAADRLNWGDPYDDGDDQLAIDLVSRLTRERRKVLEAA